MEPKQEAKTTEVQETLMQTISHTHSAIQYKVQLLLSSKGEENVKMQYHDDGSVVLDQKTGETIFFTL